jgi:hypothetical protein
MENRNTILIDLRVEPADGHAERRAALAMVAVSLPGRRRIAGGGGDKRYDTRSFVASCRALNATPHVARDLAGPGGSAPCTIRVRRSVNASANRSKKPSAG